MTESEDVALPGLNHERGHRFRHRMQARCLETLNIGRKWWVKSSADDVSVQLSSLISNGSSRTSSPR